jgi:hypothetical protein
VPVIVRVNVPVGVELSVVMVKVEFPDPGTELGEKLAVVLLGNPLALRATLPVKPFSAPTVTV